MSAIKSKGTRIEELLAKPLWAKGLKYRRNNKDIFGRLDFAFKKFKIAVFCDIEYFHGKDWDTQKQESNYQQYICLSDECSFQFILEFEKEDEL